MILLGFSVPSPLLLRILFYKSTMVITQNHCLIYTLSPTAPQFLLRVQRVDSFIHESPWQMTRLHLTSLLVSSQIKTFTTQTQLTLCKFISTGQLSTYTFRLQVLCWDSTFKLNYWWYVYYWLRSSYLFQRFPLFGVSVILIFPRSWKFLTYFPSQIVSFISHRSFPLYCP